MSDLVNPLIKKGMTAQLATRRARIAAGEKPLGWKVGLGSPTTMQKLGLQAPLIGFLMQRALHTSGSTIALRGYIRPVMEPEIGVRMARDLPGGVTAKAAAAAIKEIMPAIELADLDPLPAPDNLDKVLEGDVYQRCVLLGASTRVGGSTEGLTSRLIRRGAEMARSTDPEALTGKLINANGLAAFGEKLSAGDIIITGSITPPVIIEPDETEIAHAIDPIGEVSVRFSRD